MTWHADCVALDIMGIQSDQLKARTMQFALDVLRLVDTFARTTAGDVVGRQLAKCATSVAANYRRTCNARSRAEFIAKLGVVVEESDESEFWLDVSGRKGLAETKETERLRIEAGEFRAIFGKSLGTARAHIRLAQTSTIAKQLRSPNHQMTR